MLSEAVKLNGCLINSLPPSADAWLPRSVAPSILLLLLRWMDGWMDGWMAQQPS
jgi:hypothetical protein